MSNDVSARDHVVLDVVVSDEIQHVEAIASVVSIVGGPLLKMRTDRTNNY
jgi:hypothetical protein